MYGLLFIVFMNNVLTALPSPLLYHTFSNLSSRDVHMLGPCITLTDPSINYSIYPFMMKARDIKYVIQPYLNTSLPDSCVHSHSH